MLLFIPEMIRLVRVGFTTIFKAIDSFKDLFKLLFVETSESIIF